jgi:hypothetical protein
MVRCRDGGRKSPGTAALTPAPSCTVTEVELDAVADELNERPRKRFAFATPTEQLSELLLQ